MCSQLSFHNQTLINFIPFSLTIFHFHYRCFSKLLRNKTLSSSSLFSQPAPSHQKHTYQDWKSAEYSSKVLENIYKLGISSLKRHRHIFHNEQAKWKHFLSIPPFNSKAFLLKTASTEAEWPVAKLPEIAFIGRSNVGKSTLVNHLTFQGQCLVDASPGSTQALSFLSLNKYIILVDLPGYGFPHIQYIQSQIYTYLRKRKTLKRVFVLIDSQIGFKQSDFDLISMLSSLHLKFMVILTKCDRLSPFSIAKRYHLCDQTLQRYSCFVPPLFMISCFKQGGLDEIRETISKLCISKKQLEKLKTSQNKILGENKDRLSIILNNSLSKNQKSSRLENLQKKKETPPSFPHYR